MNFPLEYNKLSKYFDLLGNSSPDSVNRAIEKILKKHNVKSVLDLTCGTGSQVFWLAKHGYKVTGVDISPALLKLAKSKARKEKLKVNLMKGDMRTTQVGRFDAAITIFNAVGHLTKTDFKKAMQNINKNLKKGGLYVFDIFNLNSITKKMLTSMYMEGTKMVDDMKIHHVQHSRLDKKKGQLVSYDRFSLQKKLNKPRILKAKFALQLYTPKELRDMLAKNGFEVLAQYVKKSPSILTVAKKL